MKYTVRPTSKFQKDLKRIQKRGYDIASFEITPASTDDREGLRDLADHWSNVTILADKGYVGKNMKQEMQENLRFYRFLHNLFEVVQ